MKPTIADHDEPRLSYSKYVVGFGLSVALTVLAYLVATRSAARSGTLELVLAVFALVQFGVQMVFFLHVGEERRPRWKLAAAGLMLAVVLILVGGSLWVMHNLNGRMNMTPQQMDQYMRSQDSL